jgi:hypothetical protein
MHGPAARLIQSVGREYTIRNASGGSGGRSTPEYSDDGSLAGVLENRSRPATTTDSAGEDVESDLEIRAVPGDDVTVRPAGTADEYPSKLVHPNGHTYRVLDEHKEDGGVTVYAVVTD